MYMSTLLVSCSYGSPSSREFDHLRLYCSESRDVRCPTLHDNAGRRITSSRRKFTQHSNFKCGSSPGPRVLLNTIIQTTGRSTTARQESSQALAYTTTYGPPPFLQPLREQNSTIRQFLARYHRTPSFFLGDVGGITPDCFQTQSTAWQ